MSAQNSFLGLGFGVIATLWAVINCLIILNGIQFDKILTDNMNEECSFLPFRVDKYSSSINEDCFMTVSHHDGWSRKSNTFPVSCNSKHVDEIVLWRICHVYGEGTLWNLHKSMMTVDVVDVLIACFLVAITLLVTSVIAFLLLGLLVVCTEKVTGNKITENKPKSQGATVAQLRKEAVKKGVRRSKSMNNKQLEQALGYERKKSE